MSIEVNGVTLPDIPSEVLESYPYAVIVEQAGDSGPGYAALVSDATIMLADYPDSIMPYDAVAGMNPDTAEPGLSYMYLLGDDGWYAVAGEGQAFLSIGVMDNIVYTLIWANHDIYSFTFDLDESGSETGINFPGTLYFARNDSDPNYFAPKSWFDGMARQVMRLKGTSDKLTTDEMLAGIKGVELESGGSGLAFDSSASGRIPDYDHGYATSTLTLDGIFESTAN